MLFATIVETLLVEVKDLQLLQNYFEKFIHLTKQVLNYYVFRLIRISQAGPLSRHLNER